MKSDELILEYKKLLDEMDELLNAGDEAMKKGDMSVVLAGLPRLAELDKRLKELQPLLAEAIVEEHPQALGDIDELTSKFGIEYKRPAIRVDKTPSRA